MTRAFHLCAFVCCAAFVLAACRLGVAAGGDDPAPAEQDVIDEILAKWKTYREQTRSVHYEASGFTIVPKDAFKDDGFLFKQDYRYDKNGTWLIDFANNQFRIANQNQSFNVSKGVFNPRDEICSFTNESFRVHEVSVTEHRGTIYGQLQVEFIYERGHGPWYDSTDAPLLAHGYFPRSLLGGSKQNLRDIEYLRREDLALHGRAELDGQECLVLRCQCHPDLRGRALELWVEDDPRRLVRRARTSVGATVAEDLWDYVDLWYEHQNGRSTLNRWRFVDTFPAPPERPIRIMDLSVTKFIPNPHLTVEQLELKPQPGMRVRNDRTRRRYLQPVPGEQPAFTDVLNRINRTRLGLMAGAGFLAIVWGFDLYRGRARVRKAVLAGNARPRPRRFSFAVKTLMLVVALCAIAFGYLRVTLTEQSRLVMELKNRGAQITTAATEQPSWLASFYEFIGGEPPVDVVQLSLQNTDLTDQDLAVLARFPQLRAVTLTDHFTGEGLRHIQDGGAMRSISLSDSQVSDETLQVLGRFPNLESLRLERTRVTDQGMVHLRGINALWELFLHETAVTAEGLRVLDGHLAKVPSFYVDKPLKDDLKKIYPNANVMSPD